MKLPVQKYSSSKDRFTDILLMTVVLVLVGYSIYLPGGAPARDAAGPTVLLQQPQTAAPGYLLPATDPYRYFWKRMPVPDSRVPRQPLPGAGLK